MATDRTVDSIMDMWQDRYARARAPASVVDIRTNEEFLAKKHDIEIELSAIGPLMERYIAIVLGRFQGETEVENAASSALCFFQRHLKLSSVDSLSQQIRDSLTAFVSDTAYLGLATEFALMNHPARANVATLTIQPLFDEFLEASIVAKQSIRGFDKSTHGMPSDIFNAQYALVDPLLKNDLRVGFWKRGKLQANFENTFYAGALLSMMACTRTTGRVEATRYRARLTRGVRAQGKSDQMKPVNLAELRAQFRGTRFCQLVQHHLRRQSHSERTQGVLGTVALLPEAARTLAEEFIDRWKTRAYNRDFWQRDTADVFDEIIDDARSVLRPLGLATDDEAAFNLFNIVVLSYAYSAYDQLKMRECMGIARGSFPWPSAVALLHPVGATIYIATATPAGSAVVIGYGIGNLGYLLFAAGIFGGTFRILGLRNRWQVFGAAVLSFVVGTLLSTVGA